MNSSKLSLKKLKISRLEKTQLIKGGNDRNTNDIPKPKCIRTSLAWIIEE